MFSINIILAWINVHIYPLFNTATIVADHLTIQEVGLDMTGVYKYWEDFWGLLEVLTPCNYNYPGTGIALSLSIAYQHAALPHPNIYGLVPYTPGFVFESLTIGYVYRKY